MAARSSAQIALGDNRAQKLWDLVNRFPQTDMADKARQRLAKLKQALR
jgi:outer membrane protein assembly factor BamD (BamD/ComL family)